MAIVINGSGTVTGLAVGGLPDGTVDAGTVAADVATQAEIDAKLNLAGGTMTGEVRIANSSATSQLYLYGAANQKANIILNQYGVRAWHIGSGTLASGQLSISDGTTERMRFQHGGVVSIPSGIELGSGVDNTAANTLNDYEEGTWTPTFQAHGQTNPSVGYTINNGHYTKVGRLVTASFNITTSSVSGGNSGHTLELRGLPFAQKNVNGLIGSVTGVKTFNWNGTANNPVTGYVDANQSFAWLNRFTDGDSYDTGNLTKTGDLRTSGDSNQIVATIIYYAA